MTQNKLGHPLTNRWSLGILGYHYDTIRMSSPHTKSAVTTNIRGERRTETR
jgi:hypothetical protein